MVNQHLNYFHKNIRLKNFDYSQPGAYFITVCSFQRQNVFGNINSAEMSLNQYGEIVKSAWSQLPQHFPLMVCDSFVAMPNHIHCIIVLNGLMNAAQSTQTKTPELYNIVRCLKIFSTREINALRNTPGATVWQRNYYERVIRNEDELNRIRTYIISNPMLWMHDKENPDHTGISKLEQALFTESQYNIG